MSTLVIYSGAGEILQIVEGNDATLQANKELHSPNAVIIDSSIDRLESYVDLSGDAPEVKAKPAQPSEYYVFNYANGAWQFDLEQCKGRKWQEIKAARNAQEFGALEWSGYTLQADPQSQARIRAAVQSAVMDNAFSTTWTLSDNTAVPLNAEQLKDLGKALADHVKQAHDRGRILRQQITDATSETELEAIVW